MIVWGLPVNGLEVVIGASVQALIVVLTAVLTYWIALGSERRGEQRRVENSYQSEVLEYLHQLEDVCEYLDEAAMRGKGLLWEESREYSRFMLKVFWRPHTEDVPVDSWVRTQLFRMSGRFNYLTEESKLDDEWETQHLRDEIKEIPERVAEWVDGTRQTSWFADELAASTTRAWIPRFTLASTPKSRWSRVRDAVAAAWPEPPGKH